MQSERIGKNKTKNEEEEKTQTTRERHIPAW